MRGDRKTQAVENLTAGGRRVENNPKVYPRISDLRLCLITQARWVPLALFSPELLTPIKSH